MTTVIVTGALGFIGQEFVDMLLSTNECIVLGIDKLSYVSQGQQAKNKLANWLSKKNFQFWQQDICALTHLPDADYLVNFAAETHVDNSIANQQAFIHSNILGTEHLLQLVRAKSAFNRPVFIQISTDEVYGDCPPENGFTEASPLFPSSPYSASKAAADQLVMGYAKTFGLHWMIVRPTNNYGIDQYPEKLIPKNLRLLDRGKKMTMYGDGSYQRYWLHKVDTAKAILKLIRHGKEAWNNIYNISGDLIMSNKEVLLTIAQEYFKQDMNSETFMKYCDIVPNRVAEDKIYMVDDRKLRTMIGWRPVHVDFDFEIRVIVEYHRESIRYQL